MLLPLTKRRTIAVALLIGALGTSTCGLAYIDVQLSGPITLNQNWLELTPSKPLTIARDTHEIALFPNPPIKMVDGPPPKGGLIASDGRDAEIEAELVDSNGVTYHSRPRLRTNHDRRFVHHATQCGLRRFACQRYLHQGAYKKQRSISRQTNSLA